jgi:hypothetical protein
LPSHRHFPAETISGIVTDAATSVPGDHPHTALAIARELGIAGSDSVALSGLELDKLDDNELAARTAQVAVYARVTAAHKLRISCASDWTRRRNGATGSFAWIRGMSI